MVSSIERELKTIINKADYDSLFAYFNLEHQPKIIQSNYYYGTADELFKQNNASLRLRVFEDGQSEWTIKQRVNDLESIELTQFNQNSAIEVPQSLSKSDIQTHDIQNFIDSRDIPWNGIERTMSLTTHRYNIEVEYGLYALDFTQYNQAVDYELELESDNIDEALEQFSTLLSHFNITYKQSETKLARAHRYLTNE